ncbi:mediator complex subunit Med5-domain-containing protein [Irpex rosettiformis]|uniref:Mediator complex subunit Med5-domain-containing protein n=1 Tax=Irpex rosettiformis TaxID=378272 RepID=A0ACB8UKS5_9APHY|nr:mediator complex subunit Med5-domain-containing protein [Irpex rosettiformis]
MSLIELTRNAFQSGLSASKWLSLCKLYIARDLNSVLHNDVESALCNSVLVLFQRYPGDIHLQSYLKQAIQDGTLSLAIFVTTFLSAATSLQDAATLDILCKTVLEYHYMSGLPPNGSVVSFNDSPGMILRTVQNGVKLVQTACTLPTSPYHQVSTSSSELLILLMSTITDVSQISTTDAILFLDAANPLMQLPQLSEDVRHVLENFSLSLTYILGDDAKAAHEAQMMHTLQLALGKNDIGGSNADRDIITCSLLLYNLVSHRADDFGSGDGDRAVVLLIALIRWTSWKPDTFYKQLFQSAITCLAQEASLRDRHGSALLWRTFIVGRLPQLLARFEKAVDIEGMSDSEWRPAMQHAVSSLMQHSDLLQKCDTVCQNNETDSTGSPIQHVFMSELLHGLLTAGLIDHVYVTQASPFQQSDYVSKVHIDAQDHGQELEAYLESRFALDMNTEDLTPLVEKIWQDPSSHATFAEIIAKKFLSAAPSLDLETLGHVCKILYTHEHALEIVSLYVRLSELMASALTIIQDYDCESVGDPQTAVTHIGDVVIFLQATLGRYHLGKSRFMLNERRLTIDLLNSATVIYRIDDLKGDDAAAFNTWFKALFDSQIEGIEDSVLRSTRPRNLLKIAATVLSHAINLSVTGKMDKSVFDNGVQYFLDKLLIWTVEGVIKALLTDMKHKPFLIKTYTDVVQLLLKPYSCPQPVLRMLANTVLRSLQNDKPPMDDKFSRHHFNPTPIRNVALAALGLPTGELHHPPVIASPLGNPVLQAIRNTLASARAGKAPSLDIDRCLHWTNPTKFLFSLWTELSLASTLYGLETPRRIATYILTTPQASRSPPFLPIFLHLVLPTLIVTADQLVPPEQTVAVELLVSVVSSALTSALHVEWALLSACKEQRVVLGQPALAMARRLGEDLRRKTNSPTSNVIAQRLASSSSFTSNFPMFTADF